MGISYFGDAGVERIINKKSPKPISPVELSLGSPAKSKTEKEIILGQDEMRRFSEKDQKKLSGALREDWNAYQIATGVERSQLFDKITERLKPRNTVLEIRKKLQSMFARESTQIRTTGQVSGISIEVPEKENDIASGSETEEMEWESANQKLSRLEKTKASYLEKIKNYETNTDQDSAVLDGMYANLKSLNEKIYEIKGKKTGPREVVEAKEPVAILAETTTAEEPPQESVIIPAIEPVVVKSTQALKENNQANQFLKNAISKIEREDWRKKTQEDLELKKTEVLKLLEQNPNSEQANTLNNLSEELDLFIAEKRTPSNDKRIRGIGTKEKKGLKNEANEWGEFSVAKMRARKIPKTPDLETGVIQKVYTENKQEIKGEEWTKEDEETLRLILARIEEIEKILETKD